MPYSLPRNRTDQALYNRQVQERFAATQRVPPQAPSPVVVAATPQRDLIAALNQLAQLHASGSLSDTEFAAAKARVLGTPDG